MKDGTFPLSGSICVVTGATSGLGRRFSLDLARSGCLVVGLGRRASLLASLETELRKSAQPSETFACDVSDVPAFVSRLRSVEKSYGHVDILINCAGIPEPEGTDDLIDTELAVEGYRKAMEVNFFAAVAGTLTVLPGMIQERRGIVVNVSSDSGRAPGPGEPAYCASKAALSAFTESQALSIDGTGVHMHVLYPGWVPTPMGTAAVEGGMPMPPRFVRRSEEQVSQLLISQMGTSRIDIDAARIARLAPVARSLAPRAYKKGILASSGQRSTQS